ncbi:Meckel syndrome type 1 protein [Harpegnathos saltator]|uniref:Meckel syndrome type 1 protein n=1 Tax=Harpegnathos saltator TaxID=610380 RepID=UPI000948C872|nr:Meckel syndrome type 1 protein [Harpegnathos saltator]
MVFDSKYKTEKKKTAAIYRVNEPMDNLKIRVRVVQQRSLLAEFLEEFEGETRDSNYLVEEDRIFGWQEKVFSSFEIDFYADGKNCLTDYQRDYHRRIRDNNGELRTGRLYSYTENDSYYFDKELLTEPYRSYLSTKNQTALPTLRNRKPFRERYNKSVVDTATEERIRSSHYLYTAYTVMYIMVDLSRHDEPTVGSNRDSETLLCTVTYNKMCKLLTISPDFISDDDEHYDVTNSYGIKYNYWIEHVSKEQTSPELQRQHKDMRREAQQLAYKEAEIYKDLQFAPANLSTVFLSLDIVSAHGFSYDGLFINYFIDLPQHWSTKQKERLVGRTQKCLLDNKSACFSYCTDILLYYPSKETQESSANVSSFWPHLLFSVASLDDWTRYRIEGYAALPLPLTPGLYKFTIPTWRAKGGFIDALKRFFIGGSYELQDITYCSIPAIYEGKILDKSNLKIVSSGDIKININIAHHNRTFAKYFNYQTNNSNRINTDTLVSSVENVLEQFKAAKERMIQIRAMNP